jgi:hypothetical protein
MDFDVFIAEGKVPIGYRFETEAVEDLVHIAAREAVDDIGKRIADKHNHLFLKTHIKQVNISNYQDKHGYYAEFTALAYVVMDDKIKIERSA